MASKDQQRCRLTANVCVTSWDQSRNLRITRKASWPLTHRGALFLVNPGVIELLHSPPKSSVWRIFLRRLVYDLKGQAGCEQRCVNMLNSASSWALAWYAQNVGVTTVEMWTRRCSGLDWFITVKAVGGFLHIFPGLIHIYSCMIPGLYTFFFLPS